MTSLVNVEYKQKRDILNQKKVMSLLYMFWSNSTFGYILNSNFFVAIF